MPILAVDPQFDYTKTILAATGISTLIVGLISVVVQYFLKKSSDRQLAAFQADQTRLLEGHKDALKRDADAEVEKLRNKLRLDAFIYETRFGKLHDKQIDIIAELHKLILTTLESIAKLAMEHNMMGASQDTTSKAFNHLLSIKTYLDQHQIYLSKSLVSKVEAVYWEFHPILESLLDEAGTVKWDDFSNKLKTAMEPLLADLRDEFRRIGGVAK